MLLTLCLLLSSDYGDLVAESDPAAHWSFEDGGTAGPAHAAFGEANRGVLPVAGDLPKFADPANGSLDFAAGDAITIEAWVRLDRRPGAAFPYIVGKGRTRGGADTNQNWALRLHGSGSSALSFLFMTPKDSGGANAHRWTSRDAVPLDGRWHHVAVTYEFGTGGDAAGFIDGVATPGSWDSAGNTAASPIPDDDAVWVGASMGGVHHFPGGIDEVAVYRRRLTSDEVAKRAAFVDRTSHFPIDDAPPASGVVATVHEYGGTTWTGRPGTAEPSFAAGGFALSELPRRYVAGGLIGDRSGGAVIRLRGVTNLPAGEYDLLLRSMRDARLYLNGELLAETDPFLSLDRSAHNELYDLPAGPEGVVPAPVVHQDKVVRVTVPEGPQDFDLYRLFPGGPYREALGELLVAVRAVGGDDWTVLGGDWSPTDAAWRAFLRREQVRADRDDRLAHAAAAASHDAKWRDRHDLNRRYAPSPVAVPPPSDGYRVRNAVDRFINAGLAAGGLGQTPPLSDAAFLRKVTLDLAGRVPTVEETAALADGPLDREAVVDRLLAFDEWADRWTPYWMDVLAENPGLTKPTLNNTGPFRLYVHDALAANWGADRFVSELIGMRGSRHDGGPNGFGMASQNDVPLAAKAHVVASAFLGLEMKCARCHDAPGHPFKQEELFSLAAMLNNKPLTVPDTSSVPVPPERLEEMLIEVSLKPGESVAPRWPFAADFGGTEWSAEWPVPNASRDRLAAMVTSPQNLRFREVVANRLWTELIGRGLVEDAGDWTDREASHPDLLRWLARETLVSGDDLKHVARLIVSSDLYQRRPMPDVSAGSPDAANFRGPVRRRMTAEMVLDSLLTATGKTLHLPRQTHSADGLQRRQNFIDLGRPRRAWELVSTVSERDRPSLTFPAADSLNELLAAFGWRPQRQEPVPHRQPQNTALTPMQLANGVAAARLLDADWQAAIVEDAVAAESPEALADRLSLRFLSRPAMDAERGRLASLLSPGFADRVTGESDAPPPLYRRRVSWATHFGMQSDPHVVARRKAWEAGDPPTRRLTDDFRQRLEDAAWVLVNSPEFVWMP